MFLIVLIIGLYANSKYDFEYVRHFGLQSNDTVYAYDNNFIHFIRQNIIAISILQIHGQDICYTLTMAGLPDTGEVNNHLNF